MKNINREIDLLRFLNDNQKFRLTEELTVENFIFDYDVFLAQIFESLRSENGSIKKLYFKNCIFTKRTEIWKDNSSIESVRMNMEKAEIYFSKCDFQSEVLLRGFHSKKLVIENNCRFKSLNAEVPFCHLLASNSTFENINFFENISKIRVFDKCKFGLDSSSRIIFRWNTDSEEFTFDNCTFYTAPFFIKLFEHTIILNCDFKDFSKKAIIKYRYAKSQMNGYHNEQDADLFSSLELEARKTSGLKWKKHFPELVFSNLYKAYSNYGRSFALPIFWIFIFGIIFCDIYFWNGLVIYDRGQKISDLWLKDIFAKHHSKIELDIRAAEVKSLLNSLGPIGWLYDSSPAQYTSGFGAFVGFIHKALSTIMWFLLILQIRRRFKLS